MIRQRGIYVWIFLVFVASEILARLLGIRFAGETLGTLYQYLDPAILRDDLARGLYYLHSQPPLFNLGLGLVLKAFPEAYQRAFSVLLGASAFALLVGMAWLMRRLRVPTLVIGVVCLVFALTPNFLVYRHWLFYTLPVALVLLGCAISLSRFLDGRGTAWLVAFAALATALMMMRSVFHPLWLVAVVAALVPFSTASERRKIAATAFVSLLVVNLWYLKNYHLVGSYSGSTWLGLSFAKRWPIGHHEMERLKESGHLPRFWERRPFQTPNELRPYGYFQGEPRVHPALDAPYKSNGEPNFNHRDYVAVSNAMLQGDLYLVRHHPFRYLERIGTALLLYLQPGPNSVHFLVDYDFERVHDYRDLVTRLVFLGRPIERPIQMFAPTPNLFLVAFLVLLGVGAHRLTTRSREERAVHAFMLTTVLWVTAICNLIEIGENDRMRWEIEPFLAVWLACLLGSLLERATSGEAGTA